MSDVMFLLLFLNKSSVSLCDRSDSLSCTSSVSVCRLVRMRRRVQHLDMSAGAFMRAGRDDVQ